MGFSIGIVGLPNVGKSTLFKALTKQSIDISNYPFCTIDPNVGIVAVPDERLEKLSKIFTPPKTIPTAIEFFDIAGLVKGAHKGEGLGNQFLANIAQVDAIAQVVRGFSNKDIIHVEGDSDPKKDIETINLELILKDLSVVENRLKTARKEAKTGKSELFKKLKFFEKAKKHLEEEKLLISLPLNNEELPFLKEIQPLTRKPMLYVLNIGEERKNFQFSISNFQSIFNDLISKQHCHPEETRGNQNDNYITLNTKLETEYNELSQEEITELELPESQLNKFIAACYKTLGLITFYTAGEKEVRAWTIPQGATAPQAGSAIHSDFETKFIRAEVISFDDFMKAGNYAKAREMGFLRIEGKEYIIQDGDIIIFKI